MPRSRRPSAPSRRTVLRVARGIVVALAVLLTLCGVVLVVAMRINDDRIDTDLGTATATVLSVSPLRTGIEFVDDQGRTVRPPGGVLYPGLLSVGQQFQVDYVRSDPDLVRVSGRDAGVGNVVVTATVIAGWLVAGVIWWLLRRWSAALGAPRAPVTHEGDPSSVDPATRDEFAAQSLDEAGLAGQPGVELPGQHDLR